MWRSFACRGVGDGGLRGGVNTNQLMIIRRPVTAPLLS